MGKIVSLNNERVRRVRALQRSTRRRSFEGLFAAEGLRLVQEALKAGMPVSEAFFTEAFATSAVGQPVVEASMRKAESWWEVSPEVMLALADTETPQGILLVMPVPDLHYHGDTPFTLIPDSVRDPGNLGTMLRTAWAAGVSRVLFPPGTVDYLNPKVVRSGMGAHFHLAMRRALWPEIQAVIGADAVWVAEADRGTAYDNVDWRGPVTLIVGGEAEGAGPEGRALGNDHYVYIPMASAVDSLNAAMATSVLLFEAARQRRLGHSVHL